MPRRRMTVTSKRTTSLVLLILVLVGLISSTRASSDNDFDFLESWNGGRRLQKDDGKDPKKDDPTKAPVKAPTRAPITTIAKIPAPTRAPTKTGQNINDGKDDVPEESTTAGDEASKMPVNEIVAGLGAASAAGMIFAAFKQRKKHQLSRRPGGSKGHGGEKRSRGKGAGLPWAMGGRRSQMSSIASSVAAQSVSGSSTQSMARSIPTDSIPAVNTNGKSRQVMAPTRDSASNSSRIDMLRRGAAKAGKAANNLQTRSNTRPGRNKLPREQDKGVSERQALESLTEWEGHTFSQGGPPRMAQGGKREPRGARHKDGVNAFWQYASAGLSMHSAGRSLNKSRGSSNYHWRSPGGPSQQHSKGYIQSTNTEKTWGTPSVGGAGVEAPAELPRHQQGLAALLVVAARLRDDFKGRDEAKEIMAAEQRVSTETTASQFLKQLYSICGQKTVGQAVEYARNRTSFRGAMMRARERVVGFERGNDRDSYDYML